jgi:hypothetical protein
VRGVLDTAVQQAVAAARQAEQQQPPHESWATKHPSTEAQIDEEEQDEEGDEETGEHMQAHVLAQPQEQGREEKGVTDQEGQEEEEDDGEYVEEDEVTARKREVAALLVDQERFKGLRLLGLDGYALPFNSSRSVQGRVGGLHISALTPFAG